MFQVEWGNYGPVECIAKLIHWDIAKICLGTTVVLTADCWELTASCNEVNLKSLRFAAAV